MKLTTQTEKSPADSRLPLRPRSGERGFIDVTKIELLVVIAVITLLAGLLLPALAKSRVRSANVACMKQLKSMGVAFRLYANDHDDRNPFQVLTERATNGSSNTPFGPFNPTNAADLWRIFQEARNELSSPKSIVCPADIRTSPVSFAETNLPPASFAAPLHRLNAVSYFFVPETRVDRPDLLVLGDRNLHRDGALLGGAQRLGATLSETKSLEWGSEMHRRAGNIAFSDGRVEALTADKLRDALVKAGDTNNTVWLPNPGAKKSTGTL